MASRTAWMRCGIDHVELFGDVGLAGQRQHQFLEGGVQVRMAQHAAHRVEVGVVQRQRRLAVSPRMKASARHGQALAGFPAVERVGVVRQQGQQLLVAVVVVQHHRRAEAAQQRRHGLASIAGEGERLAGLRQHVHAAGELAAFASSRPRPPGSRRAACPPGPAWARSFASASACRCRRPRRSASWPARAACRPGCTSA
jgi:hypothetical protein